jgi:catechol 2,3-dioxygenase-like lactoylglutathione lyase family enzyme
MTTPHLRIARPARDLDRQVQLYGRGLGLQLLGRFEDHQGFDGVMLGLPEASWHLEFTRCRHHTVVPAPSAEDLLVLYHPGTAAWQQACQQAVDAGLRPVPAFNPYWDEHGRSFEDPDGYRIVLQNADWSNA